MAKPISFTTTIAAAATPVAIKTGTDDIRCAVVIIQNHDATNDVWIGASNVTNANGEGVMVAAGGGELKLEISSSVDPDPIYLNKIFAAADVDGQAISVFALIV